MTNNNNNIKTIRKKIHSLNIFLGIYRNNKKYIKAISRSNIRIRSKKNKKIKINGWVSLTTSYPSFEKDTYIYIQSKYIFVLNKIKKIDFILYFFFIFFFWNNH